MSDEVVSTPKKVHHFQKGVSGNPAGRPKGSKNAISLAKLQVESELRARMKPHMGDVIDEVIRQALPTPSIDPATGRQRVDASGQPVLIPGSQEMLKLLFKSWVSGTKAGDDETPREKIVIQIGKLDSDQPPQKQVTGRIINGSSPE